MDWVYESHCVGRVTVVTVSVVVGVLGKVGRVPNHMAVGGKLEDGGGCVQSLVR